MHDGLHCHMGNLSLLSNAKTRSISSENRSGGKGAGGRDDVRTDPETGKLIGPARELGRGWKVHAHDPVKPGETFLMADIEGPGAIQSMWMTLGGGTSYRNMILRIYWDGQEQPSVECPVADFFASAFTSYQVFAPITSLPVCVNPGNAFNCYWPMPFRKRARITIENRDPQTDFTIYYQVNYALADVPEGDGTMLDNTVIVYLSDAAEAHHCPAHGVMAHRCIVVKQRTTSGCPCVIKA